MSKQVSRRTFLSAASKTTAAITLATVSGTELLAGCAAPGVTGGSSNGIAFEQTPLPYSYNDLEPVIDALTMEIHYTKHAAAYTKNLNEAVATEYKLHGNPTMERILEEISEYSPKMRNNAGGHYNHELFWQLMTPRPTTLAEGNFSTTLIRDFGSVEAMKNQMTEAAKNRFGSGWAWLVVTNDKKLVVGSTPNQDNPLMNVSELKGKPLLALDVWEHAYYLKYQNKRADYIANWWTLVNWEVVQQRYQHFW